MAINFDNSDLLPFNRNPYKQKLKITIPAFRVQIELYRFETKTQKQKMT